MRFLKASLIAHVLSVVVLFNSSALIFASEVEITDKNAIPYTQEKIAEEPAEEPVFLFDENNETQDEVYEVKSNEIELFSEDENMDYTDVSHMSDEDFFGVWDQETESWTTVGKIDYAYSPDLSEVEKHAKRNSYGLAKDALYEYYKNRDNIPRADFDSGISWTRNLLSMRDSYAFTEDPIAVKNIDNTTDEYKEYTIDLQKIYSDGVFLLSSLNKTKDMIEIASRESQYSPSLRILKNDGTELILYPSKDTYIRAYDSEADYKNQNYGESEKLYVKDSYYDNGDGTYSPFSSETRRTYIAFDDSQIPSDAKKMYLTIYAKIVPEDGIQSISENSLEMVLFSAYNKSWGEKPMANSDFLPMTWADYKISHYSWNGIPGGFDWKKPDNVPSEWFNYNTRFYDVESLAKSALITGDASYMEKSIDVFLDFIKDTNGLLEITGVPEGRDLEPQFRLVRMPGLIEAYIESGLLNGDALTAILKCMWEQMTFMYNGAGCLYIGASTIPQSNNYAETNRGFWAVESVGTVCAYFPEFNDRNMWNELFEERLEVVTKKIINEDGCYQEATFGYPTSILSDTVDLWNELERTGSVIPQWYTSRVTALAKYIMNVSWPNGTLAQYGEGSGTSTRGALNTYLTVVDDESVKYAVSDGKEGIHPGYTTAYFDQLKMVASRTEWSPNASMLLMSAKNGGNHNHKDSLHMMYSYDGVELLADTGMTSYDGSHPHFQWQRHTTRSHNTIEIDGIAQRGSNFLYNSSEISSNWNGEADLDVYVGDHVDRIVAWTDATEGFRHYRNVSHIKNHNFLIVSDKVRPSDDKEHSYTQNWHTYATEKSNSEIDNTTKVGKTNYYSRPNLIIAQANTDNVNLTLENGYSVDSPSPTKYFCYTQKAAGDVMYNTLLYPKSVGDSVEINVADIETGVNPSVASAMDINIFKNDDDVLNVFYYNSFEEQPSERSFGGYTTNSSGVLIEQNIDAVPMLLSMYNGSVLSRDGKDLIKSDITLEDIEILFDGTCAVITSSDENFKDAKLTIFAPNKIEKVTLNGEMAEYIYTDNKLYLNNSSAVDFTLDNGYLMSMYATDANNTDYMISLDIVKDSVVSGALSLPNCILENNTFKISLGTALLDSCIKITIEGHTGEKVTANGMTVNATLSVGSTRETADNAVVQGYPKLEHAREDLVIWTKDATTFTVTAANVIEPPFSGEAGSSSPGVQTFPQGGEDSGAVSNKDQNQEQEQEQNNLTDDKKAFNDCLGHWAEDAINYMYANGYIKGMDDDLFAPDKNVTRAEFAAIIIRMLGVEEAIYSGEFTDVKSDEWYAGIVETVNKEGIMQGAYGSFRPNDDITREEMAVILMRVYNINEQYTAKQKAIFKDNDEISDWAIDQINAACELGLIYGIGDETFAPKQNATRAQAATVLKRLLEIQ